MEGGLQTELWMLWWVWAIAAVALFAIEVIAPGFMFLGFGVGAVVVAVLLALGLVGSNVAVLAVVFACVSFAAWFAMRKIFGIRKGQVKVWDTDINDDL